ncbi:MAG: restriction endonuclease subunit S [Candidatus Gastranaerophilales bacterium]|nr:restriction endonuclease subunit S [Candidatus Gastranaerophilales bacterium]
MIDFCELKDLCIDIIDCPHSTPKWLNEGIPVIRNYNISGGQLDLSKLSYVDEETYKNRIKRAEPHENDIIISREAPMGEVCLVPKNFKCCLGQRLVLLKVDKEKCNPHYLLYALLSPYVQAQIKKIDQTGSIVSNLNIPDLKKLNIPIIKKNQDDIAECLRVLNEKININYRINAELESMAKTIYDYWFLQFEFPNEEGEPYKSSGGKMVWNEELNKKIPEGWEVKTIKQLLNVVTGKEDANFSSLEGQYKFFTCSHEILQCSEYAFEGSAVLVAGNGDFNVKHYSGKFNAYQRTYVLIPDEKKYFAVIYMAVSQRIIQLKNNANGSIIKFITKGDIEEIPILIPIKNALLETLNKLLTAIELRWKENEELILLQKFLLPLLMNGQVGFKK